MKHSECRGKCLTGEILYWWSLAVIVFPNMILSFTEDMTLAGRLANVLLPGGLWWLLLSLSRKVGRSVLLMFPLMFFAAFQLVLLYMFGRSVIAVDMFLNLVTTNPAEVGELLGNLGFAVGAVCVLFLPPIVCAVVACAKGWRLPERFVERMRKPAAVTAIAGLLCCVTAYALGRYKGEDDLFPVNVVYNICLAVDRTVKAETISPEGYDHHAVMTDSIDGREVVVIVLGETSRGDHWQLNGYGRATNPGLCDSAFISFDKVLSESNTTHKSVPMLLSHLDATTFEDSVYCVKSIISAFGEAGYSTAFFSNQRYNRSFIDRFGFEADTTVFLKEAPGAPANPSDLALLPLVRSRLASRGGRHLIVLHTYGSHFSYVDRYEDMTPVFTPDRPLQADPGNREALVNAYDNTIVETSRLLSALAAELDSAGVAAAMIYTSDHGEDLYDDSRELFLHASPVPSACQLHVPFVLWFSSSYAAARPQAVAAARDNAGRDVSSSLSFAHTALDLGGVRIAAADTAASVARRGYAPRNRMYLTDHNTAVPLDRTGMRPVDFARLDSLNIYAK